MPAARHAVRIVALSAAMLMLVGGAAARAASPEPDAALAGVLGDPRFAPHIVKALDARDKGLVDDTLDHLRQANNAIKRAKGANHPDQLPVLDLAAELLFDAGRLDDAVTPLKRAVAIRESLIAAGQAGNHPVAMASSLLLMGRAHASKGRFDSGLESLTKAVRVLDDSLGPSHEATQQARKELADAVAIFEETLGMDHPATSKAQRERIAVEVSVGDYAAAAHVLEGMLDAERVRAGGSGPPTAGVLALTGELARMIQCSGRPEDAVSLIETAVDRVGKSADSRRAAARCLRVLAEIHLEDDATHAAAEAARRALEIDSALGEAAAPAVTLDRLLLILAGEPEDADAAKALPQLSAQLTQHASQYPDEAALGFRLAARAALAAADNGSAADLSRQAADLDEPRLGPAHPDTLSDRLLFARSDMAAGNRDEALTILEAAHLDARTSLGASHSMTLEIAESIAECQTDLGHIDAAEKVVLALVSRRIPCAGKAHETRLVTVIDGVADALEADGEKSRAAALRDGLVSLRRAQFGADDARVADTLATLGRLRLAAKKWDDAIRFYEESLAIRERGGDPDHPESAACLLAVGKAYRAVKRHEDARTALSRAAAIWQVTLGGSHPVACETMKLLALTELSLGRPNAALPLMEKLLAAYDADPRTDPEHIARLLVKLAEVRTGRGDLDIARSHLARALALRSASDAVVTAVDVADFAKRNRLADDEDAITISGARQLADADASSTPAAGVVAETLRAAWELHAAGQREAARELVRARLSKAESEGLGDTAAQAELLVTLADMREEPLAAGPAVESYRRAAAIRGATLGDEHPATIAAALRLGGVGVTIGNASLARSMLAFATRGTSLTADHAGAAVLARDIAGQTALIALARDEAGFALDAIRAQRRLCAAGDPDAQASVLEHLGWRQFISGGLEDARMFRESVADAMDEGDLTHHRCARAAALAKAATAAARGDNSAADSLLEELVASDERVFESSDPRLAADLVRLAITRERAGRTAAGGVRPRAWAAIDTFQRRSGAKAGTCDVEAVVDLTAALVEADDVERAERVLKAVIDSINVPGARKPVTAGRLLLELGDLQLVRHPRQASRSFSEALRIVRDAVGGGHGIAVAAAIRLEAASRRAAEIEQAPLAGGPQGVSRPRDGTRRPAADVPSELRAAASGLAAPLGTMSRRAGQPSGQGEPSATPSPTDDRTTSGDAADPATQTTGHVGDASKPHRASELVWLLSRDAATMVTAPPAPQPAARVLTGAARPADRALSLGQRTEALKQSAETARANGDVSLELESLRQLGALEWNQYGGGSPRVIATMLRYAEAIREGGDHVRATALLTRARDMVEDGTSERVVASVLQARLHRDRGDTSAATESIMQAARELRVLMKSSLLTEPRRTDGTGADRERAVLLAALDVAREAVQSGLPEVAMSVCDVVRRMATDERLPTGIAACNVVVLVEARLARREATDAEPDARWLLDTALGGERGQSDPDLISERRALLARVLLAAERDEWTEHAVAATRALAARLAKATPETCPPRLVAASRELADAVVAGGDAAVVSPLVEGLKHAALACLPAGHEQTSPALEAASRLALASGREDVADALLEAAQSAAEIRRPAAPVSEAEVRDHTARADGYAQ